MNILIFRTDRVGDFILTSILINSIKRIYPKSIITVLSSKKNYEFIKKYSLVDNVYILDKSRFVEMINLVKLLNKNTFNFTFIIDGKKRSIFFSLFVKSFKKIYTVTKELFKILSLNRINSVIFDDEVEFNKIEVLKKNLELINCSLIDDDLNIFANEIILSKFNLNQLKIYENKFAILHLDEKWIYNEYIQNYVNIEPNIDKLEKFIYKLLNKLKTDLIITSGIKTNFLFDQLKNRYSKLNDNIFLKQYSDIKIILCENTNIHDLIFLISKSSLLITCHGAPTHIASSFNVKSIDIIDASEYLLFNKYTAHLRKYNQITRKPFYQLTDEIINLS